MTDLQELHLSRATLDAASRDDLVRLLADLQRVADLALPDAWATWLSWRLVPFQDAAFVLALRWHAYVEGCRGRRP